MKKGLAGLVLLSLIGLIGQVNATAGDYNLLVSGTVVKQLYNTNTEEYNLTIAINNEGKKALTIDQMEILWGPLKITNIWYLNKIVLPEETLEQSFETNGWTSSMIDSVTEVGQNYWQCTVKIFDDGNFIGTIYSTTIPIDIPKKGMDLRFVSNTEKLSAEDANLVRCLTTNRTDREIKYDGLTTNGIGIRYKNYHFYVNVMDDRLQVKHFWKLKPDTDTNTLINALRKASAQSQYTTFNIGPENSIESTSYIDYIENLQGNNCNSTRSAFIDRANDVLDTMSYLNKYIAD